MTVREALNKILDLDIDEILGDGFPVPEPEDEPEKPVKKSAAKKAPEKVEEPDSKYANMPVLDLYKECKKRGMNVKQKQDASVYIKLLEEADWEADEADEELEEDWAEEEIEEEVKKPVKKADAPARASKARSKATPAKKSTKKADLEPEEDEDDWEFGED